MHKQPDAVPGHPGATPTERHQAPETLAETEANHATLGALEAAFPTLADLEADGT